MFKGAVNFKASIKGNGLSFPRLEFDPNEVGVEKVVIEGPQGDEILSTIHVATVPTQEEGRNLATRVNTAALDRLAFHHNVAISEARHSGDQFSPLNPAPGVAVAVTSTVHLHLSGSAKVVVGINQQTIKTELEQAAFSGERNFALFRSAMLSNSPVEQYMHLYNLLLMLYNDKQADVDAFIVSEEPAVALTAHPIKNNSTETVYTRLRNEFAHVRAGVNIATTKQSMENRYGDLRSLVKRAIELHP